MSSTLVKRNGGTVDTYKGDFTSGVVKAGGYTAGLWLLSLAPFISFPFLITLAFIAMVLLK